MCTFVIYRKPDSDWPIIIGTNRDENSVRSWKPPGRHWNERPEIIGGLDEIGGGSWLGINDEGLLACIINRHGTLGQKFGKRSRGEIVIEALGHADAEQAIESLSYLNEEAYRDFNLVLADNQNAFWLKLDNTKSNGISTFEIPLGISMLTSGDINDNKSERIKEFMPLFKKAKLPDPAKDEWSSWKSILSKGSCSTENVTNGMCFKTESGFGTLSSSLIALGSADIAFSDKSNSIKWLFSNGPPNLNIYNPVRIY